MTVSVDSDPHAVETQRRNHTKHKHYRTEVVQSDLADGKFVLCKLAELKLNRPDVIIGGPPCQGFTRANRQSATPDNPINKLFWKFADIVEACKPKMVVLENVGDLAVFHKGQIAAEILGAFQSLKYKVCMITLNAVQFGVPQNRNRVFFIATRSGKIEYPHPTVTDELDYRTVWDAISDLPRLANGASEDERPYPRGRRLSGYQMKMRERTNGLVANNLVTNNSELIIERYQHIPQGGNWRDIPNELMKNYANKERCHAWIYRRLPENEPSVALNHLRKNMLIHPRQDRGLSVREAARIQSFPDHFTFYGGLGFQQQQVANAVPPLLAKAVARSVRMMLGE